MFLNVNFLSYQTAANMHTVLKFKQMNTMCQSILFNDNVNC